MAIEGPRVKIWAGDREEFLGEGILVGCVTAYFWWTGDSIRSLPNAEDKPSDELIVEMKNKGLELYESRGNPKIVLDDGTVKYGCQVRWRGITDEEHQRAMEMIRTNK